MDKQAIARAYAKLGITIQMDEWMEMALCSDPRYSPDRWFYEAGSRRDNELGDVEIRRAKRVCGMCPVRSQCLEAGMDEEWGIWGGLTRRERQRGVMVRSEHAPGEHKPDCPGLYGCPCIPENRMERLQLGFIRQVTTDKLVTEREVA